MLLSVSILRYFTEDLGFSFLNGHKKTTSSLSLTLLAPSLLTKLVSPYEITVVILQVQLGKVPSLITAEALMVSSPLQHLHVWEANK